jgi:actin-related protein 8
VGANGAPVAPIDPNIEKMALAEERDSILPIMPLDAAIFASTTHGARDDDRKLRDFLGSIMVIGGGGKVPGFTTFLEDRLREMRPVFAKDILVGTPPRELDSQVVVWKGGSVFGKLRGTNDSWIGQMEYDRLGSRLLAYKCMWAW